MTKPYTCCFMGDNIIDKYDFPRLKKRLNIEIEKLIQKGYCFFLLGEI